MAISIPKLVSRDYMGLNVMASRSMPPQAYVLYLESYSDGTEKLVRGHSIYGTVMSHMLNGTEKEKKAAKKTLRSDLFVTMHAAALLNRELADACLDLDEVSGAGKTTKW
jgi:hypothetical protein